MDEDRQDRIRGAFIGAVAGDALGMPLEFGPPSPPDQLVRDMRPGPLPAGTFTDDTEMALALADSLLHHLPLDPVGRARRLAPPRPARRGHLHQPGADGRTAV